MFIKNKNASLNVQIYSENIADTIILLHGGPGFPNRMKKVISILKTKYKIITFEQRGTGNSICEKCDFSMDSYMSDINTIIDFFNIKSLHLFGYSWGGLYAQIYTNKYSKKIKSLFLCNPMSGTADIWRKAEKEAIVFNKNASSTIDWLRLIFNSLLGMLGNNNAYKKMYMQILANYSKNDNNKQYDFSVLNNISAKTINKTRRNIIKYPRLNILKNPDFPILITYGDNDIYTKSRKYVFAKYPTAQIQIIENCIHAPWFQNLEKFQQILTKFYGII